MPNSCDMFDRMIYMDHHATTPVAPEVLAHMLPFLSDCHGNAHSRHAAGKRAAEAIAEARAEIAGTIGADPREIIFTSGATEANNLAIRGALAHAACRGTAVITGATEHHAVLDVCAQHPCTVLSVDGHGQIDPAAVDAAITPETGLISLMLANNEIGSLHDIAAIGRIAKARGVWLHVDAAQALATEPIAVDALGVDLLSLSAHKAYGPQGVGALYCRRRGPRVRLDPLFVGGGQENGRRSGTLNVPGIVGFAAACRLLRERRDSDRAHLCELRERLWSVLQPVPGLIANGHPSERLPGNLNVTICGVDAQELLARMPEICLSAGAACTSVAPRPSHVLRAIGRSADEARSSIRFGLGRGNTIAEVDEVIARMIPLICELRRDSPEGLADLESCPLD
jgi:cysteine desulfurase